MPDFKNSRCKSGVLAVLGLNTQAQKRSCPKRAQVSFSKALPSRGISYGGPQPQPARIAVVTAWNTLFRARTSELVVVEVATRIGLRPPPSSPTAG